MYNTGMDRKSKILLYCFFFLFVGTVMFSFVRYVVVRDFEVVYSEPEESMEADAPISGAPEDAIEEIAE